jgi:hypothetical protein
MANFYDLPPQHTVGSSLYTVFTHYSTPWKSEIVAVKEAINNHSLTDLSMTSGSFVKMCKDIPGLMDVLRRQEIDLIFAKCAPISSRRLGFDHFLEALKLISQAVYTEEDPSTIFAKFLVEYLYGAFDHHPIEPSAEVFEKILNELSTTSTVT